MDTDMDIIDAHFHIIAPRDLRSDAPDGPRPFTVDRYLRAIDRFAASGRWSRVAGGVVVGGSRDTREETLAEALAELEDATSDRGAALRGGRNFIGVIAHRADLGGDRIARLHADGIRGIRFNLLRDRDADVTGDDVEALARRVHDEAGWAVHVAADIAERPDVADAVGRLARDGVHVAVDHMGMSGAGVDRLVDLAAAGAGVKATGFSRVDFPVADALRRVHEANPAALMFGTDLPGSRSYRRLNAGDVDVLLDVLGDWEMPRVMHANAFAFHDFS
ncbi:amidohydrolase family protein [Corynebacterium sp. 335C]